MGWTEQELPWASSTSSLASHASLSGAKAAEPRAGNQTMRLLELYAKAGPLNDAQAARMLGIERSTVNARRRPLCKRGIVVPVDVRRNEETGVINTRWGLPK